MEIKTAKADNMLIISQYKVLWAGIYMCKKRETYICIILIISEIKPKSIRMSLDAKS